MTPLMPAAALASPVPILASLVPSLLPCGEAMPAAAITAPITISNLLSPVAPQQPTKLLYPSLSTAGSGGYVTNSPLDLAPPCDRHWQQLSLACAVT